MDIDDEDRAALQFIAEGATELSGFDLASISVVDGGVLRTVAVAGDSSARAELQRIRTPVEALLRELHRADSWGPLRFLPHDRSAGHIDEWVWTPTIEPVDAPDAWHPDDLLCGLLYDDTDTLRGVLAMDLPRDGLRPRAHQRRVLQQYARQAEHAVITALERNRLARGLTRESALAEFRRGLIDVLSHELGNSVGAISASADILRAGELPTSAERPLSIITRSTRRIMMLVDDMVMLARLGRPHEQGDAEQVDLASVVRGAAELADPQAAARSIALAVSTPERLVVLGVATDLDRMVTNLVSNAIKYSDPDSLVEVTLCRTTDDDGDPVVELRVADRGIGISTEDQARLFEEFFRSADHAVRRRPGTGLGLAIVQRVVAGHRGSIAVVSELGAGTTITVLLPAEAAPLHEVTT